jgi:ribosome maturation factor RimP
LRAATAALKSFYRSKILKIKDLSEIENLAVEVANGFGFEVVEVAFKQGREPSLTIYLDKEGGIDLNDCAAYHPIIDQRLDELDPTYGAPYTLNVSSAGLDRPFKTERNFEKNLGNKVEVKLYSPQQGKKYFEGIMTAFDAGTVTVEEVEGKPPVRIPRNKIAKINQGVDFD